ncbi:MAG TPA: TIGR04282 family arsenosugar biosynthesis glycosyltransferase [Actinomycetota bacterium]|nr:TIGR04282 family arsenosugar biosynthesis glycosyltransferase [Actinomycetota bacterium]
MSVALLVIAKAPRPGRSKTRLCPPCTPGQAANLAAAALRDTIEAVHEVAGIGRRVLVFDGEPVPALPAGWTVVPQRGHGLDRRLANAFADAGGPALLIGMDTPQVTPALLASCIERLRGPGVDAVVGPADDGGYWAIGLRAPRADAFVGVPMSTQWTYEHQRRRLDGLGLAWVGLPRLRDVDTFADAEIVALERPGTRFAAAFAGVREVLTTGAVP